MASVGSGCSSAVKLSGKCLVRRSRWTSNLVLSRSLGARATELDEDAGRQFPNCVQRRKVQVCGDLWTEYKGRGWKRYRDAPSEGLVTEAEYFDNRAIVGSRAPTVLLLHGSPGTFGHFSSLIRDLTGLGVRVVSPNFPTMQLTKQFKHYRHSPEERLEFVKAVLAEADITSIDLLACHSSGTFSGLRMFKDASVPTPKALSLFNPLGFDITVPMQPYWFSRGFIKTWQSASGRFALEKMGVPLLVKMGNPFAGNGLEDIVLGGCCLHYNNREQFKTICGDITRENVPTLFLMSDNDSVMNKKMNANLLKAFSADASDATIYDKSGKLDKLGVLNNRIKVIRMVAGGHFSFLKYPSLTNPAVIDLLDRVMKSAGVQNSSMAGVRFSKEQDEDLKTTKKVNLNVLM